MVLIVVVGVFELSSAHHTHIFILSAAELLLEYVCNPAYATLILAQNTGGGVPTQAGEPEAAKLSACPDIATTGRLPTLTLVEASIGRLLQGT
jgi:hypothetical protein